MSEAVWQAWRLQLFCYQIPFLDYNITAPLLSPTYGVFGIFKFTWLSNLTSFQSFYFAIWIVMWILTSIFVFGNIPLLAFLTSIKVCQMNHRHYDTKIWFYLNKVFIYRFKLIFNIYFGCSCTFMHGACKSDYTQGNLITTYYCKHWCQMCNYAMCVYKSNASVPIPSLSRL